MRAICTPKCHGCKSPKFDFCCTGSNYFVAERFQERRRHDHQVPDSFQPHSSSRHHGRACRDHYGCCCLRGLKAILPNLPVSYYPKNLSSRCIQPPICRISIVLFIGFLCFKLPTNASWSSIFPYICDLMTGCFNAECRTNCDRLTVRALISFRRPSQAMRQPCISAPIWCDLTL